jgi:hypothetical protein
MRVEMRRREIFSIESLLKSEKCRFSLRRVHFSLSGMHVFAIALLAAASKPATFPFRMLVGIPPRHHESASPMTHYLRLAITTVVLSFLLPILQAEDSPFTLPAGEPLAILALSDGLDVTNVGIAVSKALVEERWENLGWEGHLTTATIKKSRVNIKIFALASAAEVKLYAQYSSESNVAEEKCQQVALRELRSLEKMVAEKLKLTFRKAKGEETVDRATAG